MALLKPDTVQKHPLIVGWTWAALTLLLICAVDYARGEELPDLLVAIPIWAVTGIAFGYGLRWSFARKADKQ